MTDPDDVLQALLRAELNDLDQDGLPEFEVVCWAPESPGLFAVGVAEIHRPHDGEARDYILIATCDIFVELDPVRVWIESIDRAQFGHVSPAIADRILKVVARFEQERLSS